MKMQQKHLGGCCNDIYKVNMIALVKKDGENRNLKTITETPIGEEQCKQIAEDVIRQTLSNTGKIYTFSTSTYSLAYGAEWVYNIWPITIRNLPKGTYIIFATSPTIQGDNGCVVFEGNFSGASGYLSSGLIGLIGETYPIECSGYLKKDTDESVNCSMNFNTFSRRRQFVAGNIILRLVKVL